MSKKIVAALALAFVPLFAAALEIPLTDAGSDAAKAIQFNPVTSVDAQGLLVAWRENDGIHVGGITRDGVRRAQSIVATNTTFVSDLDVASSGHVSLLAWFENTHVLAQRLDANGVPVGAKIDLGIGDAPSIAPAPTGFLVAWTDSKELQYIVTAHISFDGTVGARRSLDPGNTFTIPVQDGPALAAADSDYLLAWNDSRSAGDWNLVVAPLDYAGRRLNNGTMLASDATRPTVACGPASCLVTWFESDPNAPPVAYGHDLPTPLLLEAALVSRDGALLHDVRNIAPFVRGMEDLPVHVVSDENGNFTLLVRKLKIELASTGDVSSILPWTQHFVQLGGIERIDGAAYVVYSREGRIYALKLAPKSRAVR